MPTWESVLLATIIGGSKKRRCIPVHHCHCEEGDARRGNPFSLGRQSVSLMAQGTRIATAVCALPRNDGVILHSAAICAAEQHRLSRIVYL